MEGLIKFLKPTTKLRYIFVRSKSFIPKAEINMLKSFASPLK